MFANAHHALIVVVSGYVSAVLRFTLLPSGPLLVGGEMIAIATERCCHWYFRQSLSRVQTGPTGVVGPLYAFLLSLLIRLFGIRLASQAHSSPCCWLD
jgi:hypothetical protein